MKSILPALVAGVALLFSGNASAIPFTFTPVNTDIYDQYAPGMINTETVATAITSISHLQVTLNIEGRNGPAFNGDFYAYLTHGSGLAVLLNRVGVTAANPIGYGDNGMNITFDDAATYNIHTYQSHLPSPLTGPLTGAWAPDGRNVDPGSVLDTTPVTAGLGVFDGMNPNGEWTLFLADVEGGNMGRLVSWGLEIEGTTATPDPLTTGTFVGLVFAGLALVRRHRRTTF